MTMRMYCEHCDRDITGDDNTVTVRLDTNLRGALEGRRPLPLKSNHLDYCITCAKLLLPDVWKQLLTEPA